MSGAFTLWVVYDHPRDFPEWYIARKHLVYPGQSVPTQEVLLALDLEVLREQLRGRGLDSIGRHCNDDRNIIETWI